MRILYWFFPKLLRSCSLRERGGKARGTLLALALLLGFWLLRSCALRERRGKASGGLLVLALFGGLGLLRSRALRECRGKARGALLAFAFRLAVRGGGGGGCSRVPALAELRLVPNAFPLQGCHLSMAPHPFPGRLEKK